MHRYVGVYNVRYVFKIHTLCLVSTFFKGTISNFHLMPAAFGPLKHRISHLTVKVNT